MERIVALVEGHAETHFVNATYANAIVQRPFPNGDNVDLSLIIDAINDRLETVGNEITKVLVLLDRERRAQPAADVAIHIIEAVREKHPHRSLYVGVSDREFENWILADVEHMIAHTNIHNYAYPGDGCGGKHVLKQLTAGVDLGYRDKALLLKSSYCSRMRPRSPSFDRFAASIDFSWWWIER